MTQTHVILPIIPVRVNNDRQIYYALMDSGSTNSFASEALVSKLKLNPSQTNYEINTISSSSKIDKSVSFDLSSSCGEDKIRLHNVLVVKSIPARFPDVKINLADYPYLSDLNIAPVSSDVTVDLLIGMDNALLLQSHEIRSNPNCANDVYAMKTYFGWSICGPVQCKANTGHVTSLFVQTSKTEMKII